MSLYSRVVESYAQYARKQVGVFPLPLRRKRRKGETLDPNQFVEGSPVKVPGSGWLRVRYPAGTKYAGKADAVVSGPDSKKVAASLRWLYGKRVVQEDAGPRRKLKTISTEIDTLYVFDMDDTLIVQPRPDTGRVEYEKLTGKPWPFKRWWTVPQSLLPPFKIKAKPQVKGAYRRARQDHRGKVVVMTGRIDSPGLRKAVASALKQAGYPRHKPGDDLFLKNPNMRDTSAWKRKMLRGFMRRWPRVTTVHMWDDRGDHVEHFKKQIADLGRAGHVTHVTESWPNRPRGQARDLEVPAKGEKAPPEAPAEDPEAPMDNPGPGNVNTRTVARAAGSRLHKARATRPVSVVPRRALKSV